MRKLKGTVISNKMAHTLVVRVDTLKRHSKYQKFYRTSKKFKAHIADALDGEKGGYHIGDIVIMVETRPLSKDKRWRVIELVKRSSEQEDGGEVEAPHAQDISKA